MFLRPEQGAIMLTQQISLRTGTLQSKIIPLVDSRALFLQALDLDGINVILLHRCNLLALTDLLHHAYRAHISIYVYVDHIEGLVPDSAGLRYLADTLHITGIVSNHTKTLTLGKSLGLETIQRLFILDSTALSSNFEYAELEQVDLFDLAPALAVPHLIPDLIPELPRPFIASGFIHTPRQVQAVLQAGAVGVTTSRIDRLWRP